jgi:hypothetical protein
MSIEQRLNRQYYFNSLSPLMYMADNIACSLYRTNIITYQVHPYDCTCNSILCSSGIHISNIIIS